MFIFYNNYYKYLKYQLTFAFLEKNNINNIVFNFTIPYT